MNRQSRTTHDPALQRLADPHRPTGALLLHSGRHHPQWARRSILAQPTAWFRLWPDRSTQLFDAASYQPLTQSTLLTGSPFHDLRTLLNHPDFPGQWIGYISYDIARHVEPAKLSPHRPDLHNWPLIELGFCPHLESFPAPHTPPAPPPTPTDALNPAHSVFSPHAYHAAVQHALDYIAAGDIFQVNLAQRLRATYTGHPATLYQRLAAFSPAWYGAYLELPPRHPHDHNPTPHPQRAILSTSPELFLHLNHDHVLTRPIKGTAPADSDPSLLQLSEKDAAELHMIVDLMRNDLGKVCRYGSVRVPQPRTIESHPTIHHGVATIEGRLHHSKDIVDLLKATLPGGSVTGAPKVRAMQIIDELEPVARGPYCGAIGLLSKNHATLNLAIRTIALSQNLPTQQNAHKPPIPSPASDPHNPTYTADFSVGGGIVADSKPHAEYTETLDKAQAMLHALNASLHTHDKTHAPH